MTLLELRVERHVDTVSVEHGAGASAILALRPVPREHGWCDPTRCIVAAAP